MTDRKFTDYYTALVVHIPYAGPRPDLEFLEQLPVDHIEAVIEGFPNSAEPDSVPFHYITVHTDQLHDVTQNIVANGWDIAHVIPETGYIMFKANIPSLTIAELRRLHPEMSRLEHYLHTLGAIGPCVRVCSTDTPDPSHGYGGNSLNVLEYGFCVQTFRASAVEGFLNSGNFKAYIDDEATGLIEGDINLTDYINVETSN